MQLITLLTSIAAIAVAAPLASSVVQHAEPKLSYLKTQLIDGLSRFDGLYVDSYHTGAGLSDATLTASTGHAAKGFLNGSSWQIDFGNPFPWGLNLDSDANYAAWEPVTIDAGASKNPGFYFNETTGPGLLWGLTSNGTQDYSNSLFKNWLVCDWSHGVPQLFWHYSYYNYTIPDSCAEVWLIPECA